MNLWVFVGRVIRRARNMHIVLSLIDRCELALFMQTQGLPFVECEVLTLGVPLLVLICAESLRNVSDACWAALGEHLQIIWRLDH